MIQAAIEAGNPIPPSLVNAPIVPPEGLFYLHAFTELSTCRSMGYGCWGSIPWTAIDRYCIRHQVMDYDLFVRIMRSLDSHWLSKANKKD